MTSLLPTYALTLGSQRWTEQALRIKVTLDRAPRIDTLIVWLPISAPLSADRGDSVELKLNNGEIEKTVFTGEIDSIKRDFDGLRVFCINAGGLLARFRPAETYENVSAATVIGNLLDAMGINSGTIDAGPDLPFYVADPARTAWEHIARVASWAGATVRVNADNSVEASIIDAAQADVALLYGREITALHAHKHAASTDTFVVAGEAGAGDASSDDVMRPSTDFFAGNRPAGPALGKRWRFEPTLRTVNSAATAGAALQRQYQSSLDSGYFSAFLQPQLRCGSVVEIQQLPDNLLSSPIWLTRVEHELSPDTATTRVHFHKGGDSFNPAGLLGSLAGVIGGLL